METSNPELITIVLWVGARIIGLVFLVLILVWAFFNGQFKDMQRGRYLALDKEDVKNKGNIQ